jgi:hypothetical protein
MTASSSTTLRISPCVDRLDASLKVSQQLIQSLEILVKIDALLTPMPQKR